MKIHSMLRCCIAVACALSGASTILNGVCSAQPLTAADYSTNSTYASGWSAGQNGGFGFTPWSFDGTSGSDVQQRMDNSSPFNQLGPAWTLFNPLGRPLGTDLAE